MSDATNDIRNPATQNQLAQNERMQLASSDTSTGSSGQSKPGNSSKIDISPEEGQRIVDQAETWKKTPYAGSQSPYAGGNAKKGGDGGADCSGSVHAIYHEAGKDYPYTPSKNFADATASGKIPFREISTSEKQPGDVVLYPGHMSISDGKNFDGGGDKVHSANRDGGKPFGQTQESYYGTNARYFRFLN